MNSFLFVLAIFFILVWLLGVISYSASGLIHILLVVTIVSLLLRLMGERNREM